MKTATRGSANKLSHSVKEEDPYLNRMTVDKGVVDELLLVCGVIGTTTNVTGDEIVPVTDCLNWLQDLQRALRRDDDSFRPISILLCKWKVVQQKLLPLVLSCRYDTPMLLTIVKILVILTKPLSDATKRAGTLAIDTKSKKLSPEFLQCQAKLRQNALHQSEMLMSFKRALTHQTSNKDGDGVLGIFVSLLAEPLSKTGTSRSTMDHLTIELVLHLFRNLLSADPILKGSKNTTQEAATLHQQVICKFESELVLDIFLVVAQDMESRENQNYNLLMMELLNHLLRSQDPTAVARSVRYHNKKQALTDHTVSQHEKSDHESTAPSLLKEQLFKEKLKLRTLMPTRHSHFGGTLVLKRRDGSKQHVSANLLRQSGGPPEAKKRKNRKREAFVGSGRTSASNTRVGMTADTPLALRTQQCLYKFCQRFVKDCYGPLMKSLKNEFRRDSVRLEEGDKVVWFRLVWFFCQWCRVSKNKESLSQLIFTMDIFTFNLVLTMTDDFTTQKKYPQLSQAVAVYSEMLHWLVAMYNSKDPTETVMALGLLDRLFYSSEPLDRLSRLLSKWVPGTCTREYLCDLTEIVHVTLKLLEANAAKCEDLAMKTQKKGKKADKNFRDTIERMRMNAAEYDVNSYIVKKVVSNQVVNMYTHLLSQYAVNSPQVNHRIISFFLRLMKIKVDDEDEGDREVLENKLAIKTVTLEAMVYNFNMFTVLDRILNDISIRQEKEFKPLLSFAVRVMSNFATASRENPMLYIEALLRHAAPHRHCEFVTNNYVSEELRMIAIREVLLEEQVVLPDTEEDISSNFQDGITDSQKGTEIEGSDQNEDEEIEWDDSTNGDIKLSSRDRLLNKESSEMRTDANIKANAHSTERYDKDVDQGNFPDQSIQTSEPPNKKQRKDQDDPMEDSDDEAIFQTNHDKIPSGGAIMDEDDE